MSKYGGFSGPNTGKYGPEKPSYLDTFYVVIFSFYDHDLTLISSLLTIASIMISIIFIILIVFTITVLQEAATKVVL